MSLDHRPVVAKLLRMTVQIRFFEFHCLAFDYRAANSHSNNDGKNDRPSAFDHISNRAAEWPRSSTGTELCEQKTHRILTGYANGRGHGQLVRLHILGTDLLGAVAAGLNSLILQTGARGPRSGAGLSCRRRCSRHLRRPS